MEKRLIEVEAVVEAAETVMLRLAEGLVFIHLAVAVKVGPSLLVRQNLWEVTQDCYCYNDCRERDHETDSEAD